MSDTHKNGPTHLFTVRLWTVRQAGKPSTIRGRVEHVLSRTVRYVNSLADLSAYLEATLEKLDQDLDRDNEKERKNDTSSGCYWDGLGW